MSKARDIADLDFNAPDIDGGTIDGTVIGGATPAAVSGTTGQFSGGITTNANSYLNGLRVGGADTGNTVYQPTGNLSVSTASGSIFLKPSGTTALTATATGISVTGNVDINGGYLDIGPSSGNIGKVGFDSNNVYIGSSSGTGQIIFKNNISSTGAPHSSGDTKMVISDSGVGIGIAPTVKLEVNGGADGSVVFSGRSDGGNGNNQRFNLIAYSDGGGSGYGGGLKIQTRSPTNVFSDAITVTSAGTLDVSGNVESAGTLDVSGNVEFATTQGAGYAGTKVAGLEIGTVASGGSLLVRTPSLSSSFSSGLMVDGSYSSEISQVNLTASGVYSGGGYEGHLHLRTMSQTAIWPAITAKPNSLQFYTANTERMSISSTGEISRTTANSAIDDSITTLRYVYPDSNVARASCQCDVMYSTEHLGHNTTLWLSVLTPQASANWDAGGSATMKLTWSGFHAAGTSMAKWDCVFGNNHAGVNFRWARSAVSMLEAPDSYYGYTPGVEFYRQTADGNGFTGNATVMRVLWIKITGNASSNVCPTRTLEISGVVGGPTMKYVVAHGGYSTPTNISAIGASV